MRWLLAVTLLAGCGSGGTEPGHDAGIDLQPPDFSTTPSGPTGCRGYVQCLLDCGNDTTCSSMCDSNVTPAGKKLFNQALGCGQDWCLGVDDMGPTACVLSGRMLVDPPGMTSCEPCLGNALAALFGNACMPTNDPNCNPPECLTLYTQCGASLP